MPERAVPVTFRRATRLSVGRDQLLDLIEIFLEPLTLVVSLWVAALVIEGRLGGHNMILSLIVFSLTFPGSSRLAMPPWRLLRHIALGWLVISALLLLFGYGSRYLEYFDRDVLVTWWWTATSLAPPTESPAKHRSPWCCMSVRTSVRAVRPMQR